MKKVKLLFKASGELDIEVDDHLSNREILQLFKDRVGFSEDDLYNNIQRFDMDDIVDLETQ